MKLHCWPRTHQSAVLKEKLLAALSNGIKEVLIPKGNEKDIAELPDIVKRQFSLLRQLRQWMKY